MPRLTAVRLESGFVQPERRNDPQDPVKPVVPLTAEDPVEDPNVDAATDGNEAWIDGQLDDELGDVFEEGIDTQLALEAAGAADVLAGDRLDELEAIQEGEPDCAGVAEDALVSLLCRARTGDRSALTGLYDQLASVISAIAARYRPFLPHGVDLDDLRQEMALRLIDATSEFGPEREDRFLVHLRLDLRRHVSSFLRAESRRSGRNAAQRERLISLGRLESVNPFALAPNSVSQRLHAAIRQLRPGQRAVIAGIYWRDKQARELATELGVTVQAITAARRRAEAKLREALSGPEEPDAE